MWRTLVILTFLLSCLNGTTLGYGPDANALQVEDKEDDHRGSPDWQDLGSAQQLAAEQGLMIMIFFEAEWCGICRRLESEVFTDPDVLQKLRTSYLPVMIDVDSKSPVWFNGEEMGVRQFAQQNNISAVPSLLFVDDAGEVLAHQTGFVPAERMASLLAFIASDSFGRQSFEEFQERH